MISSSKLRHSLCIFTLLGMVVGSVGQNAHATVTFPWQPADLNDPLMGLMQQKPDSVVTFRVTQKMTVPSSPNGMKLATLQPGDVIDAAFEMPVDAAFSELRGDLGEDDYIKYLLATSHKDQILEMKIKDASDASLVGKIIYIQPWVLRNTQLMYDPSLGQLTVPLTNDDADGDGVPDTYEVPDIPLNPPGQKATPAPQRIAHPRHNLPTLKPGMPNLAGVVNQSFAGYSNSTQVSKLVHAANAHVYTVNQHGRKSLTYVAYKRVVVRRRAHTVRITRCWRAVKDALISSGLVDRDFGGASPDAFMARRDLLNEGFRDLLADPRTSSVMRNPDMAPKGAILVYEDVIGRRAYANDAHPGHVEIKTAASGQGGYISITANPQAAYGFFAGGTRKLIAVMVRDT